MVQEPGRFGAGGALGLFLLEVLGDLVDQCLEADVAHGRAVGGGVLGVMEGGGVGTGGVGCDGAGERIVDSHRPLSGFAGQCSADDVAGDRGGGTDAAGVEADDVVGLVESRGELPLAVLRQPHPGFARAAWVDEQAAPMDRTGSHVLLHGDLNGLTIGLGVIQRHLHLGALESRRLRRLLHPTGRTAVVPLHSLTVERLQPLGNRSLHSHSRSRRHRDSRNRTGPHPQTHTGHSSQHPSSQSTTPGHDAVLGTTVFHIYFHNRILQNDNTAWAQFVTAAEEAPGRTGPWIDYVSSRQTRPGDGSSPVSR